MKLIYQEKSSRELDKWDREAKCMKSSKSVASSQVAQTVTLAQSHGEFWGHLRVVQSGERELGYY